MTSMDPNAIPLPYDGRKRLLPALAALFAMLALAAPIRAQNIVMMADDGNTSVVVYDADTDTVLGTVGIPSAGATTGDTLVLPGQALGLVTDFNSNVWVIDLASSPPALDASGTNPIGITNPGEDLALSPDGEFVVVVDGTAPGPISVIRLSDRSVAGFDNGPFNSVDVCSDGSVLLAEGELQVRRFTLSATGDLTDTGESMATPGVNNVYCAPDAATGIWVSRSGGTIHSFEVPGLVPVDTAMLTGGATVLSGEFTPSGDRFFARSTGPASIFEYDPLTADIGVELATNGPFLADTFYGMDQLALNLAESEVFVSNGSQVDILSSDTLALLGSIPGFGSATGISLAPAARCGNGIVEGAEQCDDGGDVPGDGCSSMCMLEEPVIALSPAEAENVVGSPHEVVANVTFDGIAVAGAEVLFAVTGVHAEAGAATSDAMGNAAFSYLGTAPGEDSILACWDLDRSGDCDPGEPVAEARKRWILDSTPGCRIKFAGHIKSDDRHKVGFAGLFAVDEDATPAGRHSLHDHGRPLGFRAVSVSVERVLCEGRTATIEGEADILGYGVVPYTIDLEDGPGILDDLYRLRLGSSYDTGSHVVLFGNVEVHTP